MRSILLASAAIALWILTSTDVRHHAAVRAHASGHTGAGATLAVLDTGLDGDMGGAGRPHALFARAGMPGTRLLANVAVGRLPAEDALGHGTAVAAIAAGERWNATAAAGRGHAPGAAVVGYAIADDASGASEDTTVIAAWQRVLEDRVRHGIRVACNAYSGSPDPTHPVQQALDACAWAGDVLVVVAAGNGGADLRNSQAARNGLAVGAVAPDDKRLAAFSARGALPCAADCPYPDLVAQGVAVRVPVPDDEMGSALVTGTSFAAAQVAGAAALVRAQHPRLTAQEARAVLLASTEGLRARHTLREGAGLGRGYLRTDLASTFLSSTFAATGSVHRVVLAEPGARRRVVVDLPPGRPAVAVAAWARTRLSAAEPGNVDLRVLQGSSVLARSAARGGMHERVDFVPAAGPVTVEVVAVELGEPLLEVALAVGAAGPEYQPAVLEYLAAGCTGSVTAPAGAVVFPPELRRAFGGSVTTAPLALWPSRCQLILGGTLPTSELVGLTFRQDELTAGQRGFAVELELTLAAAACPPMAPGPWFSDNRVPGTEVVAFARRWLRLRDQPAELPVDPEQFALRVPFDRPVRVAGPAGAALVVETRVFGNDQGHGLVPWWVDAADGDAGSRVLASGPDAGRGETRVGFVVPVALLLAGTTRLAPSVEPADLVALGSTAHLRLVHGVPRSLGLWLLGGTPAELLLGPCRLGLLPEVWLPLLTDDYGEALLALPLPDAPRPPPVLRLQAALLDPAANAPGIVLSELLLLRPGFLP